MPNLAMRQPGTQFSADDLDLAWPLGGEREVVAVPEERLTLRIKRRIAEGHISIVDDKPTKEIDYQAREYRLLTGEEARKHMAEPAGPVTRVVYHPATPDRDKDRQMEIQGVQTESDRFKAAQAARAEAAEAAHAAIVDQQVKAEKEAAKAKPSDEDFDDPLADRLRRTEEASAEWHAAREAEFAEREKARQALEVDELKQFEKRAKLLAKATNEPDTSAEDKAFAEREKARQAEEAKVEKERAAAAKAEQKEAEKVPSEGYAGKTDPYIAVSPVGRRPTAGITNLEGSKDARPSASRSTTKKSSAKSAKK